MEYKLIKEFYYKNKGLVQQFSDGKKVYFIVKSTGEPIKIPTICEAINQDIPTHQLPESKIDCNIL